MRAGVPQSQHLLNATFKRLGDTTQKAPDVVTSAGSRVMEPVLISTVDHFEAWWTLEAVVTVTDEPAELADEEEHAPANSPTTTTMPAAKPPIPASVLIP